MGNQPSQVRALREIPDLCVNLEAICVIIAHRNLREIQRVSYNLTSRGKHVTNRLLFLHF